MTDNTGGRPREIESPERFDELVDQYISDCTVKEEPITWTGMALALGLSSRQSIDRYAEYDGFSDSVKRAKLLVENAYEKKLHTGAAAGPIFALKNMNWADKTQTDLTAEVKGEIKSIALVAPDGS